MRNRTYGGVRGRETKVGEKLLRFPPTRFLSRCVGRGYAKTLLVPSLQAAKGEKQQTCGILL